MGIVDYDIILFKPQEYLRCCKTMQVYSCEVLYVTNSQGNKQTEERRVYDNIFKIKNVHRRRIPSLNEFYEYLYWYGSPGKNGP